MLQMVSPLILKLSLFLVTAVATHLVSFAKRRGRVQSAQGRNQAARIA